MFNKVLHQAMHGKDRVALVCGRQRLSHAELAAAVASWAGALQAEGLRPGDRLGVSLRERPEHVVALLAAATAGLTILPLDWRAPPAERARLATAFGASAVLTEPGGAPPPGCRVIPVDAGWCDRAARAPALPVAVADPAQPLLFNMTSGTSGEPKAAVVTQGDFEARLARQAEVHGQLDGHRYLSAAPLCFSGGLMYCLYHLVTGNTVLLYPPLFSAGELVQLVRDNGISYVFLVPTALRWLLRLEAGDEPLLPDVRVLLTSAAPITAAEKLAVRERVCPNFFESYATSAAGTIAALRPADLPAHADSVGRPLRSIEMQIVDDDGGVVGAGVSGRVRCRGAGVSGELLASGGVTALAERLDGGWYYTGDLGRLGEDGFLRLVGRADGMIIRGGVNVRPGLIEQALREHPAVADVAVVGRPSADLGEEVVAFVQPGRTVSAADLLAHCRGRLPGHMVPARIEFLTEFPRSAAGKIRRSELP